MRFPMLRFAFLVCCLATGASAQAWEAAAPMSVPRRGAASVVLDGRLYVVGGVSAGSPLRSAEVFAPGVGWRDIAAPRLARVNARAGVVRGEIVVAGGRTADGPSRSVEIYSPATNTWRDSPPMEQARDGMAAGVVGGLLYAIGGAGAGEPLLRTSERRDSTWSVYTPWVQRLPRALAGSAVWRDTLVVAGGFGALGPVADVDAFVEGVPSIQNSIALPRLSSARGGLALVSDNQSLFAVGGRDAANERVATVERLDVARDTFWTNLADLPVPREDAVAAVLGDDLYVSGGATAFGTVLRTMVRLRGVAVDAAPAPRAAVFEIARAGPNPARGRVRLRVTAGEPAHVRLTVLDMRGRTVAVLADETVPAGTREVMWDASRVAAGVYSARLDAGRQTATVRFVVVR